MIFLAARHWCADPAIAINQIENHKQTLYLELQMGLLEIVGSAPLDDLLDKRAGFGCACSNTRNQQLHNSDCH